MTLTEPQLDLDVHLLSGSIGMIRGLDVRHLDDRTTEAVRQIWLDRKVVFFPEQHLDPAEHLAFAAVRRAYEGHPVIPGLAGQ